MSEDRRDFSINRDFAIIGRRYLGSLAGSPINELHLQRYSPPQRTTVFVPSYCSTSRVTANWRRGNHRRAIDRRVFHAHDVSRANFLRRLSHIFVSRRQIDPVLQFKVLQYFRRPCDDLNRQIVSLKAEGRRWSFRFLIN